MKKLLIIILALVGLSGCYQKGSMEKAGERTDEVIDNIKKGDPPLKKKGTIEKMGQSIDETFNDNND